VIISLIAAMARHRVIGKDQTMPWHLPADLAHFKKCTLGKPIVMGRKTFESIGRALPGRRNIVITHQAIAIKECEVFHSLNAALAMLMDEQEIMITGGGMLYRQALPWAHRLYLTFIDAEIEGDTVFPQWNECEWQEISNEPHSSDKKNPYEYRFVILERLKSI